MIKVLALASYPERSAATRFRIAQFAEGLRDREISVELSPFLSDEQFQNLYTRRGVFSKLTGIIRPLIRRMALSKQISQFDVMFVQREAVFFGPAFFENLYLRLKKLPMVLDLDDATYVAYESPTYGKFGSLLKFFGKTDKLIDRSDLVICGNRFIAEYAEKRGAKTVVIPTIVDTEIFRPNEKEGELPVIGWIGTHSTFPFLESIFPVLSDLSSKHRFKLKVVGAGKEDLVIPGVEVENLRWELSREVEDFRSFDIGVYPMDGLGKLDPAWLAGKSGFKAIQYLAVGIPFVMTPIGVCAEIGEEGKTHFNANNSEDWYNSLDALLSDASLRKSMGHEGRKHSLANYSLEHYSNILAESLIAVANKR